MMKYVYGSMATIALLIGLFMLFGNGMLSNALLVFIFAAACMVAAEISELSDKLTAGK